MTDSELTGITAGSADETLSKCAICLGPCNNKCHSNSCMHEFCLWCLQEWSKTKTQCPICKKPFRSIIYNIKSPDEYDEIAVESANIASDASDISDGDTINIDEMFIQLPDPTQITQMSHQYLEQIAKIELLLIRQVARRRRLNYPNYETRHIEQRSRVKKRRRRVTSSNSDSDSDYEPSQYQKRKLKNELENETKTKRETRQSSGNKDNLPQSSFVNRRKRSKHAMHVPHTVTSSEDRKQTLRKHHRHSSHFENAYHAKKKESSSGFSKCMQGVQSRNRSSGSYSEHKCVNDLRNDDKHEAGPSNSGLRNSPKRGRSTNLWFSRPCSPESDSSDSDNCH